MLGILPPAQMDVHGFHPGAQPHVGQPQQRQGDVIAKGMRVDALLGELGKAGVDFRGQGGDGVVILQQAAGFLVLGCIVDRARGQVCGIDTVAVAGPVDFIGGGEVGGQGSDPADKAG